MSAPLALLMSLLRRTPVVLTGSRGGATATLLSLAVVLTGSAVLTCLLFRWANSDLPSLDGLPGKFVEAGLTRFDHALRKPASGAPGTLVMGSEQNPVSLTLVAVPGTPFGHSCTTRVAVTIARGADVASNAEKEIQTTSVIYEVNSPWPTALAATGNVVFPASGASVADGVRYALTLRTKAERAKPREAVPEVDEELLKEQLVAVNDLIDGLVGGFADEPGDCGFAGDVGMLRRLNGSIQWWTVLVAIAVAIQMGARLFMTSFGEWSGTRAVEALETILEAGDTGSPAVDSAEFADRVQRAGDEAQARIDKFESSSWFVGAKWSPSAPRLFRAGAGAYLVSSDYGTVPAFVDSEAASVAAEGSGLMGITKYMLWAMPSLGFIGTVVGIGDALYRTTYVQSPNIRTASEARGTISSAIGVAFDTTLVALFCCVATMFLYYLVGQLEDLALARAKRRVLVAFVRPGALVTDQVSLGDIYSLMAAHYGQSIPRRKRLPSSRPTQRAFGVGDVVAIALVVAIAVVALLVGLGRVTF